MASMASRTPGISIWRTAERLRLLGLVMSGCRWRYLSRDPEFRSSDLTWMQDASPNSRKEDRTREVDGADLRQATLIFTADPGDG